MVSKESQKSAEKSRIEQKKGEIPRQRNQVINQLGSGQGKETIKPQVEHNANKI